MFEKIYHIRTKIENAPNLQNKLGLLSQLREIAEDAMYQRVENKELENKLLLFIEIVYIDIYLSGLN